MSRNESPVDAKGRLYSFRYLLKKYLLTINLVSWSVLSPGDTLVIQKNENHSVLSVVFMGEIDLKDGWD